MPLIDAIDPRRWDQTTELRWVANTQRDAGFTPAVAVMHAARRSHLILYGRRMRKVVDVILGKQWR